MKISFPIKELNLFLLASFPLKQFSKAVFHCVVLQNLYRLGFDNMGNLSPCWNLSPVILSYSECMSKISAKYPRLNFQVTCHFVKGVRTGSFSGQLFLVSPLIWINFKKKKEKVANGSVTIHRLKSPDNMTQSRFRRDKENKLKNFAQFMLSYKSKME